MSDWITLIAAIVFPLILIVAAAVFLWKRSRPQQAEPESTENADHEKAIDLESLDLAPRDPRAPRLRLFGIDSTLVVLVMAPRGNRVAFPPPEQLHSLVERIVPGFARVLDTHQPLFRKWEPQMSFEGFTHAFANQLELPGDHGKGTRWTSICGKLSIPGGQLFVGLISYCDDANELGQLVVEHEGKWADTIRVIG